jgi:adenosylhomocysteine nucleosidase
MSILILVALEEEFDKNLISNSNVVVEYTGVGVSNAAMKATLAIIKHMPEIVINYGSAGSLHGHKGLLTVHSVCQRDANCEPLKDRGYMLGENVLYYRSFEQGVKCGSGNNFVTDPDEWTREHCDIVDMELWSIAKVCNELNVPWISRKWVSDSADGEAGLVWEDALAQGQKEFVEWFNSGKYLI